MILSNCGYICPYPCSHLAILSRNTSLNQRQFNQKDNKKDLIKLFKVQLKYLYS